MITRQEYLLGCLSEECHEAGKAAIKALRFGVDENRIGKIRDEVRDVIAVLKMLDFDIYDLISDDEIIEQKMERRERYAPRE